MDLARDGDVLVLSLGDGANVIDLDFIDALAAKLDEVEAACDGPGALVITASGKFFCNGLNLPVVMAYEGLDRRRFGSEVGRLFGRLVVFPVPTVAALNGHAFAAGAVLAAVCDYRIMREDRGWICLSEVDAGVPIAPPMMNLLRTKLSGNTVRDAVLSGKRFTGPEAVAAGFADGTATEEDLVAHAMKHAAELAGKERRIFGTLKRNLWGDLAEGLGFDPRSESGEKR